MYVSVGISYVCVGYYVSYNYVSVRVWQVTIIVNPLTLCYLKQISHFYCLILYSSYHKAILAVNVQVELLVVSISDRQLLFIRVASSEITTIPPSAASISSGL